MQKILFTKRVTNALLVLLVYALPYCGECAASSKLCVVSVFEKELALGPGEKVDGFQLNLQEAWVQSVEKMPNQWTLKISNAQNAVSRPRTTRNLPYWTTQVEAHALSKTALIDLPFFQKFLVVEKDEKDATFDAELTVFLSTRTMKTHRRVLIPMHQLVITPVTGRPIYAAPGRLSVKDSVSLRKNERIANFTLALETGIIQSFAKVPFGWQLELTNSLNGTAVVKGKYGLGASRVGSEFTRDLDVGVRGTCARLGRPPQARLTLDLEDRDVAIQMRNLTSKHETQLTPSHKARP